MSLAICFNEMAKSSKLAQNWQMFLKCFRRSKQWQQKVKSEWIQNESVLMYACKKESEGHQCLCFKINVILTWAARQSGWWQHSGRPCWCRHWASPHPLGWWPGPAESARCWWEWSSGRSRGCPPAHGRKAARDNRKIKKHKFTSFSSIHIKKCK